MTEAEIIRELEEVLAKAANPEDAYTTEELCDILGLGRDAVRNRLKALKKVGRLQAVTVLRENLAGVTDSRPAYKILPDEAA